MADINLAAVPIDDDLTRFLQSFLQNARAGKFLAVTVVWVVGPENGGYQNFLGKTPLSLSALCEEAAAKARGGAFQAQSPIIAVRGNLS